MFFLFLLTNVNASVALHAVCAANQKIPLGSHRRLIGGKIEAISLLREAWYGDRIGPRVIDHWTEGGGEGERGRESGRHIISS